MIVGKGFTISTTMKCGTYSYRSWARRHGYRLEPKSGGHRILRLKDNDVHMLTARNPYDRLISLWSYHTTMGRPGLRAWQIVADMPLNTYVRWLKDQAAEFEGVRLNLTSGWYLHLSMTDIMELGGMEGVCRLENQHLAKHLNKSTRRKKEWWRHFKSQKLLDTVNEFWCRNDCEMFGYPVYETVGDIDGLDAIATPLLDDYVIYQERSKPIKIKKRVSV